jgi:prophage regulatory protein
MREPQKVIQLTQLFEFTGLRRSQIEHLVAKGLFPRPVRLSARRKAWLASEIAAWQADRIFRRDTSRSG